MTTITENGSQSCPPRERPAPGRQMTAGQLLLSEWAKLFTVRSTTFTLLLALVLGVGFGLLFTAAGARDYLDASAAVQRDFDPVATSTGSYIFAQLALGSVGVSVFASEYATGTIRTSLTSVPRRGRLLAAKTAAFTAVAVVAGQVIAFLTFFAGQAVLSARQVPYVSLGDPDVPRAVIGCGLYLAAVGVLGLAFGALVRSTTIGLVLVTGATLVVPAVTSALPDVWRDRTQKWWPPSAAEHVMEINPPGGSLGPGAGLGLLVLSVVVLLVAAFGVFRTRDA